MHERSANLVPDPRVDWRDMALADNDAADEERVARAMWRTTARTMKSGLLIGVLCFLGMLALFPWRDSLGTIYGYWVFAWFGVFIVALLVTQIRGYRQARGLAQEWREGRP